MNGPRARGLVWWMAWAMSSLPGARLAFDQDGGLRWRDELHAVDDLAQFLRVADDARKGKLFIEALVQLLDLDFERFGLERALDKNLEALDIDRLGEKIDRAALHRLDCILDVAIGRHHDDRGLVRQREGLVDDLQAGFARHAQVGDDNVELPGHR